MSRRRRYSWLGPLLVLATAVPLLTMTFGQVAVQRARGVVRRPNIVLIVTDDQRLDTLWAMPNVRRRLSAHGVTFTHGYVTNPVCCPSRATMLTGQYSHSTGVYTNKPGYHGGVTAFDASSTIATWLHEAGYVTGLFGKYLNGYEGGYVPPGWDHFFATWGGGGYYDYLAQHDGSMMRFGSRPADYATSVLARDAVDFMASVPNDSPFFVYFAPHAPHEPAVPAPGDERLFGALSDWRPRSYDEADVSDKPEWLRRRPRLAAPAREELDRFRLAQLQTIVSLDREIGALLDHLEETGRISNTLIVFTSDNGMMWGEHRLRGKAVPYEESVRVPFVLRWDAMIPAARPNHQLVLNIDIAPTLAAAAGVSAPGAEGRNVLRLIADPSRPWREKFLIEHLGPATTPTQCTIHTRRHVLTRYETGETELYDLRVDPAQLSNLSGDPDVRRLESRLIESLRRMCQPAPPGFTALG
jgi:arylsulfatase A-like enzyme